MKAKHTPGPRGEVAAMRARKLDPQWIYRNTAIRIIPVARSGRTQWMIDVHGRRLTYVQSRVEALQIACNLVDVQKGGGFMGESPAAGGQKP